MKDKSILLRLEDHGADVRLLLLRDSDVAAEDGEAGHQDEHGQGRPQELDG